jgi:ABC-type amino acid transport substrate-binding protein
MSGTVCYHRETFPIAPARVKYSTIADFVGKSVGAVQGMAAERDLLRRAPQGVRIASTATFPDLYEQFGKGELEAIAQAEYFMLDERVIPSYPRRRPGAA